MKKELQLRDYQVPAANFIFENQISVLALAPNGGKTEISIYALIKLIEENPKTSVLILTHSTNVLKDNYTNRLDSLKLPFKYSTCFDKNANVHICLPHSEYFIKNEYDILVVDEAHENYLAPRVQRILKIVKPKKQILLTGTPSPFIKNGSFNIHTIAANDIPTQYMAKLQIELVATNYKWIKKFKNEFEIKKEASTSIEETKDAMELILLKLFDRVKNRLSPEEFNSPSFLTKLKKWAFTYKKLGKTLIFCRSINQAYIVYEILRENKVSVGMSHSENDPNSSELIKFKDNKFDVLVVVDRGRLGYSDNNLFNIIDMSGTHNPNVIYQIFSRVLRGTPSDQKYYLKITTQEYGMMDFTHSCVSAALMLTDKKYLSTYDGDNFNGIKIPMIKKLTLAPVKTNSDTGRNRGGNGSGNGKTSFIFPQFTHDVIDMFKNIIHDLDEPVTIYKMTTIGEVRNLFRDKKIWTEESILATIYE